MVSTGVRLTWFDCKSNHIYDISRKNFYKIYENNAAVNEYENTLYEGHMFELQCMD